MTHPDELERILESGLASYRKAEPLAGLEERVIGRIGRMERPQRNANGWFGALALGLAGMVVAGLVFIPVKRSEPRPVAEVRRSVSTPVRVSEPQQQRHVAHVGRVRTLPKGPVFPTPSRLTTEERLMAAMVSRNPDEAAEAFESLRRRVEEPIAIAPIMIPPIAAGEGQ